MNVSDQDIVRDVRRGDREAFGRLVRTYQGRLFGLVLMMVREPAGAEEVTQDAFVRAYTHLDQYDDQRPVLSVARVHRGAARAELAATAWADGAARRHVARKRAGAGRDGRGVDELIANERDRRLWQAVAALPSGERTAVILYYRDEIAVRDIALALGVTTGTIKTLLFRARRHLRERLGPRRSSRGDIYMTCRHALDLIDAETFTDYPRAHLDAARQHARQCATCGPALEAATALTAGLVALPQPAPPPDLAAAVLARIARIEPGPPLAARCERRLRATGPVGQPGGVAAGMALVLLTPMTESATTAVALPTVRGITRSGGTAVDDRRSAGPRGRPRALHGRAVCAGARDAGSDDLPSNNPAREFHTVAVRPRPDLAGLEIRLLEPDQQRILERGHVTLVRV